MNPTLPHVPPNIVTLQCITRTTVVTETPVLDISKSNGKENLNPTGKLQCTSPKKPSAEQLRMQFQSLSGPPKKRLSPKRSSASTGGKFDKNLQPIEKSNNTDPKAAPTGNQAKPRPSQSFETVLRGKKLSNIQKPAPASKNLQDPHDLVNKALYPSHPPGSYYKYCEDDLSSRHNHVGLKVQFVDDVPRSNKRKYSYQFGHFSPMHSPANWQNLVSLTPRFNSRASVHSQSTAYTPTRHFVPHQASQHHQTPERWMRELISAPLIRTPQSLYYQVQGQQSSSSQLSTTPSATRRSTRSATKVRFVQPEESATLSPGTRSAKKARTSGTTPKRTAPKRTSAKKIIFKSPQTTKPCKCAKSHCLKLYCECFENGRICVAKFCKCKSCKNQKDHLYDGSDRANAIKDVLKRKPTAFQQQIEKK